MHERELSCILPHTPHTLLIIYNFLISPYITYGLSVWGLACKSYLNKILCLICFAKKTDHSIPLFTRTKLLPVHSLYYKNLCELMHDVNTASAPVKIRSLFMKTSDVHSYSTRSSTSNDFKCVKTQESVLDYGMRYHVLLERYHEGLSKQKLEIHAEYVEQRKYFS